MAKRLAVPSENVELRVVGDYDDLFIPRIQRLSMNEDLPTTDIYEIG